MKRIVFLSLLVFLLLSACSSGGSTGALPTVSLDQAGATMPVPTRQIPSSGGVTASGVVAPAQQAQVAAPAGANIQAVNAVVGDHVNQGQVLVRLAGSERLNAAASTANLELLAAEQAVKDLNDSAGQARALAQKEVADAQKALKDAQTNRYSKNLGRVSQATVDAAQAELILAQDALKKAQEDFQNYASRPPDDVQRAQAFARVAAAQKRVDDAQRQLDWLLGAPDTVEISLSDAAIAVAQAQLDAAQKKFDLLKNGPDPDALALATARVDNARVQLAAAQAALADLELKAPFSGVVVKVNFHAGEWVAPGQPVLVIADMDHLQVLTTDLSERDIPKVKLSQTVSVQVKPLNQELTGHVSQISYLADTIGGDVVYQTTIVLDSIPDGLRAGMSVDVRFNTGP